MGATPTNDVAKPRKLDCTIRIEYYCLVFRKTDQITDLVAHLTNRTSCWSALWSVSDWGCAPHSAPGPRSKPQESQSSGRVQHRAGSSVQLSVQTWSPTGRLACRHTHLSICGGKFVELSTKQKKSTTLCKYSEKAATCWKHCSAALCCTSLLSWLAKPWPL